VATSLAVGSPTEGYFRLKALKSKRMLMRVAAKHPAFRGKVTRGSGARQSASVRAVVELLCKVAKVLGVNALEGRGSLREEWFIV
jgi:hypothetical protein